MTCDLTKFVDTLSESHSLTCRQKADIIRAVRAATGQPPLDVARGDVYKSTRGLRLVVEDPCGRLALISLNCFDDQYKDHVGRIVGRAGQTPENLELYLISRNYVKVGKIEDLLKGVAA